MVVLTGTNLNERHKNLNLQVNDAAKNNVDLHETSEASDVEKLFKINLASKYRNIDYVIEALKSGDSVYISKALKCEWIFDNEFEKYINPQYLERDIFPVMALRMKKKVLTAISMRLRNSKRAEEFHHYCMRNKMNLLGMKFLLCTNESFKIEILTQHPHVYNDFHSYERYVENFIGDSFLLAEYYLKVVPNRSRSDILFRLRYLYSLSEEKYLDLLENFQCDEYCYFHVTSKKVSLSIMKKYKNRVLKDPRLYINILEHDIVTKYSTSDDAKVYAVVLLPEEYCRFWSEKYIDRNDFFLKLINISERFSFIKKIFTEKYPGELFEDAHPFFIFGYYKMLTEQEKENWALNQISRWRESHKSGDEYFWYRFVNFQVAFPELKKCILITPDNNIRNDILKTAVESTKTQEELTTLLMYYYSRHVNELKEHRRRFLDKVIEKHNVLKFNDKCWDSFEKILYSIDVYYNLSEDYRDYENNDYRALSLLYHVLHEKPVPEVLKSFLLSGSISIDSLRQNYDNYMDPEQLEKVYQYALSIFTAQIMPLTVVYMENQLDELRTLINGILDVIVYFEKKFDDIIQDIRDFIMDKLELLELQNHSLIISRHTSVKEPELPIFSIRNIINYLKENSSHILTNFSQITEYFECRKKNVNWLIRKLKIYFIDDLAPEYVKLLLEYLGSEDLALHAARVAVYGILNLSDEERRVLFLEKYTPDAPEIDHVNINRNHLNIQIAICSVACHSRPRLPLSIVGKYIKGHYVQHCIPIFDSYMANLIPAQCLSFVESLLDTPVSAQKHGLRLAFRCFSNENLKALILKVWKKTKNVSIKKILYESTFDKINNYRDNISAQWDLFGALDIMTHDLNHEDVEEVLTLMYSRLPDNVYGHHLQSAYIVANTFPKTPIHYQILAQIVRAMYNNFSLIPQGFLVAIAEDHLNTMFDKDEIFKNDLGDNYNGLHYAKWNLINNIIIKLSNMHFVNIIKDKTLINWHKIIGNDFTYRKFYTKYLNGLERLSYNQPAENYLKINDMFRTILTDLENVVAPIEIYILVWRLKLNILTRQVLGTEIPKIGDRDRQTANKKIKEIILKFSHELKNMMVEYCDNGMYFVSLSEEIQSAVHDAVKKLKSCLDSFTENGLRRFDDILTENGVDALYIDILLCSVLSTSGIRDLQLFVVNFLPRSYQGECRTEYLDVISMLKSIDDKEIKYYMCHKFYSSGFEYLDYMP